MRIVGIAALLAALVGGGIALTWKRGRSESTLSAKARERFEAGRLAYSRKQLQEALSAFDEARAAGYPESDLERYAGLILAAGGQAAEAEPLLSGVLARSRGSDAEVAESLSMILTARYAITEAIPILERWARDAPRDARPLTLLAEMRIRQAADPATILATYQSAVDRDPTSLPARIGLAEQHHILGDEKSALREFEAALTSSRDAPEPSVLLGMGRAHQALGDESRALEFLERAVEADRTSSEAATRLATILLRRGDPTHALAVIDRAVQADPFDPESRYARGMILARLERTDESRSENETMRRLRDDREKFNKIQAELSSRPEDPDLTASAARWMIDHGRSDEAAEWARLSVRIRPSHPIANAVLAEFHGARGEVGLANSYRLRAGK
jgi:tetratricopeptide (TPR) repeat protein